MLKSLIGRVALYGFAPQVSRVASFLVLPIISKYLTPEDYGVAGVVTAYTSAFGAFQSLGLNVVTSNAFYKSRKQYKWLWRQIYGFLSIWAFFFALFFSILLYFLLPDEVGKNKWIILALNFVTVAFINPTNNISIRFYHLSQKAKVLASRTAIIGILTVLINLYTIAYLNLGYMGWFISNFLGNFLSLVFFAYSINVVYKISPIFNFKVATIKKALKISLPTLPHYYSGYLLNTSDKVVMDVLNVNIGNIGLYNLAGTLNGYFGSLVEAISLAVSPTYLKMYVNGDDNSLRFLKNLTFLLQISLFVVGFLSCIWLKEVFDILIKNSELHQAYPIAIILIMSSVHRPMYMASLNKLFVIEKTKNLWKVTFVAGLTNVILNFLLVPYFGVVGAALVTFITSLYVGYSGFMMEDFKKVRDMNYYPLFWFFSSLVVTVAAYFLVELPIGFKFALTTVVLLLFGIYLFKVKNKLNFG